MPSARIRVRVQPRARSNEIAGVRDGSVVVRVTAPPEGGKANAAVCRLLSRHLGVPKSSVEVVTGAAARTKVLQVSGMEEAELRRALGLDG
jgi:uncharacterized protein